MARDKTVVASNYIYIVNLLAKIIPFGTYVREGGGWGRICQVISWDIDGLDGGNGTLLGGGNSFLHLTHIGGQGWLVTDSGWDTTQKGGYFGTGLKTDYFLF